MKKRPGIALPTTKMERIFQSLSIVCILMAVIYIASVWSSLPNTVPTHFNAAGEPDGWGGKESIWFLPVLSTFLFILFFFLSKVPHLHNYPMEITEENAEKMYRASKKLLAVIGFEVCFFLAIAAGGTVQSAFGKDGLGWWYVPLLLIVLFSTIFFHLYKLTKIKSSQ
jgi:uncharacterized membrane protein